MKIISLRIIVSFGLSLFCSKSISQKLLWEKSYGGVHSEYLLDAVPTADYGFILAGSSMSGKTGKKFTENQGNLDYWLWKMNERGEMEWQQSIGGSGRDLLYSIAHTYDGGFILGGSSESNAVEGVKKDDCKGGEDYWVVKLDAFGEIEWEKTLGGSGQDVLAKVVSVKGGGYLLGGSSNSDVSEDKSRACLGGLDFWVVKIDSKGEIEWEKTLGGQYQDILQAVIATEDEGFLLGGYTNSPSCEDKNGDSISGDFWVVKLDKDGNVKWERTYGEEGSEELTVLLQTKDGNYILGGSTTSSIAKKGQDIWLVKITNDLGGILWQKTYNIGEIDLLTGLTEDKDGNLIMAINSKRGSIFSARGNKKENIDEYVVMKLSDNGTEQWTKNVGSSGTDILRKAIMTRDGGYLLAGMSDGSRPTKYKSGYVGRNDFWVVKLLDEDKEIEDHEPIEAIPNPTESYTNIIIGYEYQRGSVSVFDLNGRKMYGTNLTGNRTIPINLNSYPTGIYVVYVKTDVQENGIKVIKK